MRAMGRVSMVLAAGLLAGAVGIVPALAQEASPASYATPEDTVHAYLAAYRARDLDALLAAGAVDEIAEHVDFEAYIERLQAWMPFQAPAPATDTFLIDLNRVQQANQLLGQARMLTYGLLTDVDLDGATVAPVDAAWAQAFAAQLDLTRLDGLEIGEIILPDPDVMGSERYQEVMAKQAAVFGADEMTERVATISLEGRDWLVGFTLMRFGDAWHVSSQTSVIGNLPVTGVPQPVGD